MIMQKIELSRSVKGIYSWTVSIEGKEGEDVIGKVKELDGKLLKEYENKGVE